MYSLLLVPTRNRHRVGIFFRKSQQFFIQHFYPNEMEPAIYADSLSPYRVYD